MSPKLTFLALLLATLTAGRPTPPISQNTTTPLNNSTAPDLSTPTLAKPTTANPPFDPYFINNHIGHRTDGDLEGDIFRLTKCFCVETSSYDLPPLFGQFYGSYYGFDYYNYHQNRSYAFSSTCASGESIKLGRPDFSYTGNLPWEPKCLAWMEEERKECWDTDDGNKFCMECTDGKDYYHWNGQKRRVHNHPPAVGTTNTSQPQLNEECQRMCQTIPASTPGLMLDMIPSDRNNKINLHTQETCAANSGVGMGPSCRLPAPKHWEYWNYIETYSDQADMCKGCA